MRAGLCLRAVAGAARLDEIDLPLSNGLVACAGAKYQVTVTTREVRPGLEQHRIRVTCLSAGEHELSVGYKITYPGLQTGHVAMPAAVYAGNKFRSKRYAYSCIVCDPEDFRADLPNTISNVPRLPRIQLLAGDLAMPAVGVGDFETGEGTWLMAEPGSWSCQPMFEAVEGDSALSAAVFFPGVREGERYKGCGYEWVPSEDHGWSPRPGEELTFSAWTATFPATTPHDLYHRLFDLRHQVWPAGGRHELPWSAAFDLIEAQFNALHWEEADGYYACGDRQTRYAHWQVGWVGGGISSYALNAAGQPSSQSRGDRTLDFMCGKGLSPSGFFWSFCVDGQVYSDMIDMDYGHDWHLVRRSGDALYFACKQIANSETASATWLAGVRRCADAFCTLWHREGQFGQFVSQATGEIRVGATTSGAIAPAGLALASVTLDDPSVMAVARASALAMVERFLDRGYTSGGPGEAAQCPDSESAFGLLESLVTLYEVTGESSWIGLAEQAAWLCASWVMPYDFVFPPDSTFGRLDMRTTGSVWANSQNKHSAPGICTLSGVSLFKLYRATGDRRYLDLLKHIAHGVTQYLSRDDRPVFGAPPGYMCERVNTSDWEHPEIPVGEGFPFGCWCETSALLTYAEVPGLYVQPDTRLAVMLDHGDVTWEGDELVVTNGTAFPMRLRVFAELSSNMPHALGQDFLKSGATVRVPAFSQAVGYRI